MYVYACNFQKQNANDLYAIASKMNTNDTRFFEMVYYVPLNHVDEIYVSSGSQA